MLSRVVSGRRCSVLHRSFYYWICFISWSYTPHCQTHGSPKNLSFVLNDSIKLFPVMELGLPKGSSPVPMQSLLALLGLPLSLPMAYKIFTLQMQGGSNDILGSLMCNGQRVPPPPQFIGSTAMCDSREVADISFYKGSDRLTKSIFLFFCN